MNTKFAAALLAALCASLAAPAFASGYGPAPFYRPAAGAPASQRGQSAQTVAAELADWGATEQSYGGVADQSSQSGRRAITTSRDEFYGHH